MVAPRARLADVALDPEGNVLAGASVMIYEFGTSTPVTSPMYTSRTGAVLLPNSFSADALGFFEAWLDGQPRFVTVVITQGGRTTSRTMEFSPDPQYIGAFKGPAPWVDVTAYGVQNTRDDTETRDDTAALQAVIDAQGTNGPLWVLYFPPGYYYFRGLKIPSGTTVLGAGMDATFLVACVGASGYGITEKTQVGEGNTYGCQFIHLKQFTIRGQGRWASCIRLGFNNPTNNVGYVALDGGTWSTFSGMTDVVAQLASGAAISINSNVLSAYNCWGESSATGWFITGSTFSGFQLNAEDNSQYGFRLQGSLHNLYGAQLEPLPASVPIFIDGATYCTIDKGATICQAAGLTGDVIVVSGGIGANFVIDHTLQANGPIGGHYLNYQGVETLDYGPGHIGSRLVYNSAQAGQYVRNGPLLTEMLAVGVGPSQSSGLAPGALYLGGKADHPLRRTDLVVPYTASPAGSGVQMHPSIALPNGGFVEVIASTGWSIRVRLDQTTPIIDSASPNAMWAVGAAPVGAKVTIFNDGGALRLSNCFDSAITSFVLNWRSV